jgi:sec-independent protein translocase protein TatC
MTYSSTQAQTPAAEEHKQPLLAHLLELRNRLFRSAIAVAVGTGVCLIPQVTSWIFDLMTGVAGNPKLIYVEMTEMMTTYFKVGITAGLILAMPYIIFELVMFVSPGLTSKEKKYVYLVLPWVALMFLGGVVFGYFVLLPPGLDFLLNFGDDIATAQIRVGNYVSLVTRLLLAVGIVFEVPVVLTFLAKIGVVRSEWLAKKRKWAIIFCFIGAAIITPTPDPLNQLFVAVPMVILYEASVWLAKLVQPKRS